MSNRVQSVLFFQSTDYFFVNNANLAFGIVNSTGNFSETPAVDVSVNQDYLFDCIEIFSANITDERRRFFIELFVKFGDFILRVDNQRRNCFRS